ncbi:MAG: Lrp/AsnC family transcriptional regulator [Deltaproteobacteria bacterium]
MTTSPQAQVYDQVDMAILSLLQADATITNAELAKQVGLSPSACLGRTRRLKEAGILKGFVAILDEQKVGLEVVTFVFVSLTPHNRKTTEAFLKGIHEIPQVMECHNISGVHDYLLKIVAPSISDYRSFIIDTLIEVPGVDKIETSVVLSCEKLSHQLPLAESRLWKEDNR